MSDKEPNPLATPMQFAALAPELLLARARLLLSPLESAWMDWLLVACLGGAERSLCSGHVQREAVADIVAITGKTGHGCRKALASLIARSVARLDKRERVCLVLPVSEWLTADEARDEMAACADGLYVVRDVASRRLPTQAGFMPRRAKRSRRQRADAIREQSVAAGADIDAPRRDTENVTGVTPSASTHENAGSENVTGVTPSVSTHENAGSENVTGVTPSPTKNVTGVTHSSAKRELELRFSGVGGEPEEGSGRITTTNSLELNAESEQIASAPEGGGGEISESRNGQDPTPSRQHSPARDPQAVIASVLSDLVSRYYRAHLGLHKTVTGFVQAELIPIAQLLGNVERLIYRLHVVGPAAKDSKPIAKFGGWWRTLTAPGRFESLHRERGDYAGAESLASPPQGKTGVQFEIERGRELIAAFEQARREREAARLRETEAQRSAAQRAEQEHAAQAERERRQREQRFAEAAALALDDREDFMAFVLGDLRDTCPQIEDHADDIRHWLATGEEPSTAGMRRSVLHLAVTRYPTSKHFTKRQRELAAQQRA